MIPTNPSDVNEDTWRVYVKRDSRWVADDDHDTPEQADRRKAQLEAHGETVRVWHLTGGTS